MVLDQKKIDVGVLVVGILTLIVLIYFLANSINKFWIDNVMAITVVLLLIYTHKKLYLNWFIFLLISVFIILHNLGSFGIYASNFYHYEWDKIVHLAYGIVAGFFFANYFSKRFGLRKDEVIVYAILFTLGISVVHEVIEYLGSIVLGQGDGMLFFGAGDLSSSDTEWDLIYGFVGAFFSSIIGALFTRQNTQKSSTKKSKDI